ncbi:MAG TPA: YciI family protein [Lapillicoccus sp.]|nr:YciI family protein [Lapillicoccus sp.]
MKYVLMYSSRPDLDAAVPEERRAEVYGQIFQWFETHASAFVDSGAELQGPETATTVRTGDDGAPVVVDGPYSEAKEAIGGFSVIDVENLDAALELARSWPSLGFPGIAVEVRPIVEHEMG